MMFVRRLATPHARRALSTAATQTQAVAPSVPLLIDGELVQSAATSFSQVHDPATQEVVCTVPDATKAELDAAVAAAVRAAPAWAATPVQQRQRIFFKLQALIREHTEELAASITREQGKTLADARGDVFRGLEVVEMCCNAATLMMGETLGGVGGGIGAFAFVEPVALFAVLRLVFSLFGLVSN
jgi:malonate-semialdehyde dehydrogenase (acetylating)/methylmalonate-semialdehyde dehydrogenase